MPRKAQASPAAPRYLTRREVAAYLNCSPTNVVVMVRKGFLPEYDLSPFVKRYRVEDIEAFVQSRRKQPQVNIQRSA